MCNEQCAMCNEQCAMRNEQWTMDNEPVTDYPLPITRLTTTAEPLAITCCAFGELLAISYGFR